MVKGENVPKVEKAPEDTVLTWPYFLMLEFLAAAIMFIALMLMAWLVNAPLEARADPNCTPNPSKAPWYFLNLQELLLHMHPALAGVIVPTAALVLLGAIPYVDRSQQGLGRYLGTPNSKSIAFWSTIVAVVITAGLIAFDEFIGTRRILTEANVPV
ncbi:MAG: hypothetical protein IT336_09585, partial [Thermomicrobiales bacterium]|nr:hypothetical protein [Thermomicrobiales bacterium]